MLYFSVLPLVFTTNRECLGTFPWAPYADSKQSHEGPPICPLGNIFYHIVLKGQSHAFSNWMPYNSQSSQTCGILSDVPHHIQLLLHVSPRTYSTAHAVREGNSYVFVTLLHPLHSSRVFTGHAEFLHQRYTEWKWTEITFWESYTGFCPGDMFHITHLFYLLVSIMSLKPDSLLGMSGV